MIGSPRRHEPECESTQLLLRPPPELPAPQLSLVGGLAAALAAEDALELAAQVKWPNDVMVDRRKVAGVLAEAREGTVVLGIGLNVNQTRDELPADARMPVASLRTIDGRVRDREQVLASLLAHLDGLYAAWRGRGLDAVYEDLGARDFLRGRRVSVDGVSGTAQMIARDGRLELTTDSGPVAVACGEVLFHR